MCSSRGPPGFEPLVHELLNTRRSGMGSGYTKAQTHALRCHRSRARAGGEAASAAAPPGPLAATLCCGGQPFHSWPQGSYSEPKCDSGDARGLQ